MFKKSIFLSLAVALVSNVAAADCMSAYENARESKTSNIALGGLPVGAATIGSSLIGYAGGYVRSGIVVSGAGVAAGVSTSAHYLGSAKDLNNVISLIMESQIEQGLYLSKLTSEINKTLEVVMSDKGIVSRVKTNQVAQIINDLNQNKTLCHNDLLSYSEVRTLVISILNQE